MKTITVKELNKRLVDISNLSSVLYLLEWDQSVNMPEKASDARAASVSQLSSIVHNKFINIDHDGLLTKLKAQLDAKKIKGKDAAIVSETWRSFERNKKLPEKFIKELSETRSKAQNIWAKAREKNNFKLFSPWLSKTVSLKRQEAKYVGYKGSPYNALLEEYEPGMTVDEASKILNDLKDFLIPFLKKIKASKVKIDSSKIKGKFPIDKQIDFNKFIIEKMGFDMSMGRIDESTHPFTVTMHSHDVRLTTRYSEDDIFYSIGCSVHEAGHGIYEQGLPVKYFGTPLAEAVSYGVHESQSRIWENNIGKSKEFWKYFLPKLQKEFPKPYKNINLDELYKIMNKVSQSLIRTEADEVTYSLHIIMRFEIEKEMIEGTIDIKDLPKIWKSKMKEYFDIDVPNDALGVLQDIHWSIGSLGYFPSYAFGNLYAAQFYSAMEKEIPNMSKKIAKGQFGEIKEWLNKNIHIHGKAYKAGELVKKVTGESLNSKYFIEYLGNKYKDIYNL
jgi:carboxypeptidase Taq